MHLTEPAYSTPSEPEWDDETREFLGSLRREGASTKSLDTRRNPQLLKRWLVFGGQVLSKSTLPAREREIAILRMGWLCRASMSLAITWHRQAGRSQRR